MQGMILFSALGGELLVRYRIRLAPHAGGRAACGGRAVNNGIVVVVLASAVAYGTPLLYAALGELLAERSGVLNLGVEGMMLVGAVMGFWAVQRIGGPGGLVLPLAIGVAALAGAVVALIHAFLVITLRASQIVSGLALTIFAGAAGLSSYLGNDLELADAPAQHAFRAGRTSFGLEDLPIVGPIVFGQTWLVYASWVCVVLVALYLSRTRPGLNVRAVGESPAAADAMGINVVALPLRAHPRRRRVRRRRRRLLQPRDHAAVGRRAHRRRGLDRDRARHLRVLAARPLPRRRVLLRRVPGAAVHAAGARRDDRARAVPGAAVRDDRRRARARLVGHREAPARRPGQPRRAVRARGAIGWTS